MLITWALLIIMLSAACRSLSPFFPFYFALASLSSHLFLFFFDQAGFEEKGKEKVADRWRRVLGGNPRFVENEEKRRGTVIKQ